jgi:hypothetical protein
LGRLFFSVLFGELIPMETQVIGKVTIQYFKRNFRFLTLVNIFFHSPSC